MTNEIIIHGKATAQAEGQRRNTNSKPVFFLETGEFFTSATDAAKAKGVSECTISACCLGRIRSVKGQHCFYVSKATENLNLVAMYLRSLAMENAQLKAKADRYDEIIAKEEAERKAKEETELKIIYHQKLQDEITNRRAEREAKLAELAEADKADAELFIQIAKELEALKSEIAV